MAETERGATARGEHGRDDREDGKEVEKQEEKQEEEQEVVFEEAGDLGIGVRVDADGAVVVSKLQQLKGHAELSCPTLRAGDVLVAIDGAPVVDLPFGDVMQRLHAAHESRPTRLDFVGVGRFASADDAVHEWRQSQSFGGARDDDPRFREGEFEVAFEPQQPTGLRFAEGYIMTNPLKLSYVELALFNAAAGGRAGGRKDAARGALLHRLLVRVNDDSVLGAPVDDVMALLYEPESFPKTLWLAHAERLQSDFQVVTLAARDQLMWLCFVPVEMMMEVAVVSYAALATATVLATARAAVAEPNAAVATEPSKRGSSSSASRRDGIREDQYLMAVNGFPTLRISTSTAGFSDPDYGKTDGGIVAAVNASLDTLLPHKRVLRLRDLRAYRREFLAHAPLSPWQRRRSRTRTNTAESSHSACVSASSSPMASGDEAKAQGSLLQLSPRTPHAGSGGDAASVRIQHEPQGFAQIVRDQAQREAEEEPPPPPPPPARHADPLDAVATATDHAAAAPRRPVIKRYHGLGNCEGVRLFTPETNPRNVKTVTVPDNRRGVGVQLETDVLLGGRAVFKAFRRCDGPARASGRVRLGDRLLAVNGVAVDAIPTDLLVRILHGEHESLPGSDEAATTPRVRCASFSDSGTRCRHRRVLRLARVPTDRTPPLANGLMDHARKLLAASKTRFVRWSLGGAASARDRSSPTSSSAV